LQTNGGGGGVQYQTVNTPILEIWVVSLSLESVNFSEETDMEAARFIALFVAMFFGLFIAILLPLIMSGERGRAAEDRARARRIADARMNARLLRLNL
jgi:hypothetical protein